jgi:hypothetical protein
LNGVTERIRRESAKKIAKELNRAQRRITASRRVQQVTLKIGSLPPLSLLPYRRGMPMSGRLKLLVVCSLLLSLNGCIILPGHRHCCWRYDAVGYHEVR